ncbi:hypothetical protein K438DRAFT_1972848 [Mycena galopus ATCC 62051]|nr:hypothetical protein K438DRAFT_1972848 [Mycena galopus ATCC 62051]
MLHPQAHGEERRRHRRHVAPPELQAVTRSSAPNPHGERPRIHLISVLYLLSFIWADSVLAPCHCHRCLTQVAIASYSRAHATLIFSPSPIFVRPRERDDLDFAAAYSLFLRALSALACHPPARPLSHCPATKRPATHPFCYNSSLSPLSSAIFMTAHFFTPLLCPSPKVDPGPIPPMYAPAVSMVVSQIQASSGMLYFDRDCMLMRSRLSLVSSSRM